LQIGPRILRRHVLGKALDHSRRQPFERLPLSGLMDVDDAPLQQLMFRSCGIVH